MGVLRMRNPIELARDILEDGIGRLVATGAIGWGAVAVGLLVVDSTPMVSSEFTFYMSCPDGADLRLHEIGDGADSDNPFQPRHVFPNPRNLFGDYVGIDFVCGTHDEPSFASSVDTGLPGQHEVRIPVQHAEDASPLSIELETLRNHPNRGFIFVLDDEVLSGPIAIDGEPQTPQVPSAG